MPKSFSRAEIDPRIALGTLRELASYGFCDDEFELVHHWRANGKLIRFRSYCEELIQRKGLFRPNDNNHLLHLRLICVLKGCSNLPLAGRSSNRSPKKP